MSGRVVTVFVAAALVGTACSGSAGVSPSSVRPNDPAATTAQPDDTGGSNGTTGSSNAGATAPVDVAAFEPGEVAWERYNDAVDVATIEVPVDYAAPEGARFELSVARYNAIDQDNKIGSLLINPGGPGFPGTGYAFFAAQVFDRPLLDRFDIIGWDPRGTGASTPAIDCIDDYDPYFTEIDKTPATDAERDRVIEVAKDFARECIGKNRDVIQHVGTNNSARDIDVIRRALGEDQISYFGFSYGSELGGVWATLFPDTVRAAVLDGSVDPGADTLESELAQLRGLDAAVTSFLARCSADEECEFHNGGDAESAFDALLLQLDEAPIPSDPGRPPVNRDVALTAIAEAMYTDTYWPALEQALAAAQAGDGSGLLALHDRYYQRKPDGRYGNELEAFQAISCADRARRPTVDDELALSAALHEAVPRLAPEGSVSIFCTFFPPSIDPEIEVTGGDAGPIVVIGTTGDFATPLASTQRMAEQLEDGRLVVVEADQHTGYGANRCVIDVVNTYLIDLEPPADGTECR
jgi:pimeloyl-ACP methyl ester carboxylesterase